MHLQVVMSRAADLCDHVLRYSVVIAAIGMLVVMSAVVVLQVAVRNIVGIGVPGANELARFTSISMVYLMLPYLLMRGQFISVNVVSSKLKGCSRFVVRLFNELAVLVFGVLSVIGFQRFLSVAGMFTTPALQIPNWMFFLPATIGIVLLTLGEVVRIAALICGGLPDETSTES